MIPRCGGAPPASTDGAMRQFHQSGVYICELTRERRIAGTDSGPKTPEGDLEQQFQVQLLALYAWQTAL